MLNTKKSKGEHKFNKIIKGYKHTEEGTMLTKQEIRIAKRFFLIGWHQSILHTIDLLENQGME